ncbi:hypothetical protein BDD12DRAFT_894659 [Trichophaea hybrida]|nr:hypothetical protein BDD12DRAFT_894659 [Trichophaea hybrida]
MASNSDVVGPSFASPAIDLMNDPTDAPDRSHNPNDTGIQESDHCRICRSEGTPDEPLYHPCKCSGSIKFVHQDCLMEWLQHSQKKYCELCKTPFTFTKLYDPDMPQTLPTPLFLRQLTRRLGRDLLFWARAVLVGFVWLGVLPWCVWWMWRGWFWVSDGGWWQLQAGGLSTSEPGSTTTTPSLPSEISTATGRGIVAYLASPALSAMMSPVNGWAEPNITLNPTTNATGANFTYRDGIFFEHNPFFNSTRFQFINRLIVDILEGQLLTALIVVSFIIIFLIREWVVQQQPALIGDAANIPLLNEQPAPFLAPAPPAEDNGGDGDHEEVPALIDVASARDAVRDAEAEAGPRDEDDYEGWMDRALGGDGTDGHIQEETGSVDLPQQRVIARPRRRRPRSSVPDYDHENHAVQEATEGGSGSGPDPDDGVGNRATSTGFNFADFPQRPTPTRENTSQAANLRRDLEEIARSASANSMYDFGGTGGSTDNLFHFGGGNPESSRPSTISNRENVDVDFMERLEIIDTGRSAEWMRENVPSASGSPVATERTVSDAGLEGHDDGRTDESGTASWGSTGSFEMIGKPKDKGKEKEEESSPSDIHGTSRGKGKGKEITDFADAGPERIEEFGDDESRTEGSHGVGTSEWSTTAQVGDTPVPSESSPTPPPLPPPPRLDSLNHYERRQGVEQPVHIRGIERIVDAQRIQEMRRRLEQENFPGANMPGQAAEALRDIRNLREIDVGQRPQPAALNQGQARNVEVGAAPQGRRGILDWFVGDDAAPDPANQQNANAADDTDDEDAPAAPAGGGAPPALVDDDAADDFEGIMELVGMRGPLLGLVQNAAISSMLITATVAVGVAFPYVTGKTVMMILAHPILFFLRLPTMAVSFCAEFLVDSATMVAFSLLLVLDQAIKIFAKPVSYIVPGLSSFSSSATVTNFLKNWATDGQNRVFAKFTSIETTYLAIRKYPPSAVPPLSLVIKESIERLQGSITWVLEKVGLAWLASTQISAGPQELSFGGVNVTNPIVWAIHTWEDTVATVNFTRAPNSTLEYVAFTATQHIQHHGAIYRWSAWDRIGVVLLGYAFFTVAGMLYVRRRRGEQAGNVEKLVVEFLQQCGGVMKVVLIIGIEMFLFPLYCGVLLDIAMLPLFETATVVTRIQFTVDFPLTNVFVHWFVGTCYMFHFALFVSMCRKIMRTGVLHFIRDPDDPTFHPVRDVLNRPVLTQLRKIGFSAFIYGILVLVCLGGVIWGLYGATEAVLPIHWSSNEPVFEFPVDLLFYNFLMPLAFKFFKPSDVLQNLYGWWFRLCARSLRLSSFMFGERKDDEEGHTCHPTWTSFLLRKKPDPEKPVGPDDPIPTDRPYFRRDGGFVRAPASDSVRRPKGTPVFIAVDEENRRFDVDPSQDIGPTGPSNPDWRHAYIPPYFKVRIAVVVIGVWFFAACTGVSVTIVPLLLGRYLLQQLVPNHIRLNDIYAFSVGVYLLGGIVLFLANASKFYTHLKTVIQPLTTAASNATYPEKLSNVIKTLCSFTFRTVKIGYVVTAFAIVIPTLVALIIELYFIIPLHTAFGSSSSPTTTSSSLNSTTLAPTLNPTVNDMHLPHHTIHFVQDWTIGVLYVKMMGRMMLLDDNSVWARSLRGIIQHGWLDPDAMLATKVFIAPCVGGMVAALLLPLACGKLAVLAGLGEGAKVYRYAFPAVMVAAIAAGCVYAAWKVVERWKENVRDEVYLRGMKIHNHGEEGKTEIVGR